MVSHHNLNLNMPQSPTTGIKISHYPSPNRQPIKSFSVTNPKSTPSGPR